MRTIIFGYDYFLPETPLPNGLTKKHMNVYIEKETALKPDVPTFEKIYDAAPSVMHGPLYHDRLTESKYRIEHHPVCNLFHTNGRNVRIHRDRKVSWVYLVEPFGGINFLTGHNEWGLEGRQFGGHGLNQTISLHAQRAIRNKDALLVIGYQHEGMLWERDFKAFHKNCALMNINASNLVVIVSDFAILDVYKNWCNKNNTEELRGSRGRINFIVTNWYEEYSMNTYKSGFLTDTWPNYETYTEEEKVKILDTIGYEEKKFLHDRDKNHKSIGYEVVNYVDVNRNRDNFRKYHFLNFNRRRRQQRILLTSYLFDDSEVFNKINLSMGSTNYTNWPTDGEMEAYFNTEGYDVDKESVDIFNKHSETLRKMTPIKIDVDNFDDIVATSHTYKSTYMNSYINLVSECALAEQCIYFSEKTWKPLAQLQPAIFMNTPGSLAKLRELGYKTFSPFIDESYDEIEHPVERLKAISNEVKRICKKPIEEVHEWYYSILDDLLYNQKRLLTLPRGTTQENVYDGIWHLLHRKVM